LYRRNIECKLHQPAFLTCTKSPVREVRTRLFFDTLELAFMSNVDPVY